MIPTAIWTTAILPVFGVIFVALLVRAHLASKTVSKFDFYDLLMERGRASLYNVVILFVCGLLAWTVVKMVTVGVKTDPTGLITAVVGVLLAGKEFKRGIEAYSARGASPPPPPRSSKEGGDV